MKEFVLHLNQNSNLPLALKTERLIVQNTKTHYKTQRLDRRKKKWKQTKNAHAKQ